MNEYVNIDGGRKIIPKILFAFFNVTINRREETNERSTQSRNAFVVWSHRMYQNFTAYLLQAYLCLATRSPSKQISIQFSFSYLVSLQVTLRYTHPRWQLWGSLPSSGEEHLNIAALGVSNWHHLLRFRQYRKFLCEEKIRKFAKSANPEGIPA